MCEEHVCPECAGLDVWLLPGLGWVRLVAIYESGAWLCMDMHGRHWLADKELARQMVDRRRADAEKR